MYINYEYTRTSEFTDAETLRNVSLISMARKPNGNENPDNYPFF